MRGGGGGREGGRGGEGDLIEPPKYKQLTSKSGLQVFPPAPIWVCIHRWTLLKPGNLAISYKTLRKQCMKTDDFWNRSSCIFKRLILLIFILFFFVTWVLYYPGYCGLTLQLQDLTLKIGLENFVASVNWLVESHVIVFSVFPAEPDYSYVRLNLRGTSSTCWCAS